MNTTIQVRNLVELPVLTDVDENTVHLIASELRLFAETLEEVGRPTPPGFDDEFDAFMTHLYDGSVSRVQLQLTEPGVIPQLDDGWVEPQRIGLYFKETDMLFTDVLRTLLEITHSVSENLSSQYQQGIQHNNAYKEWSQIATFLDLWVDLTVRKSGILHFIYER